MDRFQYQPLQTSEAANEYRIRLISLHAADPASPLSCAIEHFPLSSAPSYEALSYCWGNPKPVSSLICNSTAHLTIAANLQSALLSLRPTPSPPDLTYPNTICSTRSRLLWIDAICINQSDLTERAAQVSIMRHIYSQAARVIVWLGEADVSSPDALRLMRALARAKSAPFEHMFAPDLPKFSDPAWASVPTVWKRDYWDRAWVVQEIGVAGDESDEEIPEDGGEREDKTRVVILLGGMEMGWVEFVQGLKFLYKSGLAFLYNEPALLKIGNIVKARRFYRELREKTMNAVQKDYISTQVLATLLAFRIHKATNKRDHVFAFYGFMERELRALGIEPDYNISSEDLYKKLAVAVLERSQNLDIFSVPRPIVKEDSGPLPNRLPSWVPDWSIAEHAVSILRFEVAKKVIPFKADGGLKSLPVFDVDKTRLGLEGIIVDEIMEISRMSEFPRTNNFGEESFWKMSSRWSRAEHQTMAIFTDMERVARARSPRKYFDGSSMLEVYWVTLRAGSMPEGYSAAKEAFLKWDRVQRLFRWLHPLSSVLPVYRLFILSWCSLTVVRGKFGNDKPMIIPQHSFLMNTGTTEHRRMIRTKRGYVGLAPGLAKVGDRIAICKGGKCPLIIRQREEEWILIGDAFIYGMMNSQQVGADTIWERIWLV